MVGVIIFALIGSVGRILISTFEHGLELLDLDFVFGAFGEYF